MSIGTRLGPYEILSAIGAGGMGEVYKARDTRLKREVAVKIIAAHVANDPERVRRFEQEAQAAAALNHPNILAVFDIGTHDGAPYIVTELLDGETLREKIRLGVPWPVRRALDTAVQILRGLGAAHAKGIVHRDLKPENVFVTADGQVKILDFGLAKLTQAEPAGAGVSALTTSPPATQAGVVLGTMGYMSPEQLRGLHADPRADIFAFGAVLYELLSGTRAFAGETPADTQIAVLTREPPDFPALTSVPLAVERVMRRCLAKQTGDRFQSARDLSFALEAIADGSGPLAVGAPQPPHDGSSRTRTLVQRLGWFAAAAAGVTATVTIVALMARARPEPDVSPVRFSLLPPARTTFVRGQVPQLSPDGQRVAIVARDESGEPSLWVRPLESAEDRKLAGTENATSPFWSPDGKSLGFFASGKLKRIDLSGGLSQTLADVAPGYGGAWNRDGTILFAPSVDMPLSRISATGGSVSAVTRFDRAHKDILHGWPQFLPDSRRFLFFVTGRPDRRGVHLGSLDSPDLRVITTTGVNAVLSAGHLLIVREGTLVARSFDVGTGQLGTETRPIATDVGADGSGRRALVSVSDNGRLVYGNDSQVEARRVLTDRSGTVLRTIGSPRPFSTLALSADGRTIAEERDDPQTGSRNIWTVSVASGLSTRVTGEAVTEQYAVWSPDGARIAYMWFTNGPGDLYLRPASGTGQPRLLFQSEQTKFPTDWSRDGRFIAYFTAGANYDLWVLPLSEPSRPVPIGQTRFNESDGHFSPDGRWLAYVSDESGRAEVYVSRFPSGERLPISSTGGSLPQWRGDGKELFYVAPDGTLVSVDVRLGQKLGAGPPRALFKAPFIFRSNMTNQYAVTPDGQQLLLRLPVEDPTPFTMLLNWPAFLKR